MFLLVYGQEAVVPLHFQQHTKQIATMLRLDLKKAMEYRFFQLNKLKEDRLTTIHHKEVQKQHQKEWHDRNIWRKDISIGDPVLLYDSRIKYKPRKLDT